MVNVNLDSVNFNLKEEYDFSWIKSYGKVFEVFSQNDSGNICFGVNNGNDKYFIKVAGIKTMESKCTTTEAIHALKSSMSIYENINHVNLIQLIRHYPMDDIYIAVFKWAEGDCLFDHWNFEKYINNPQIIPPAKHFKKLPISKRIKSADVLFSFLEGISKNGYVAVDFYDGSIMYDFKKDTTTICDIDLFRKKPTFNNMGEDYWGTKRLKAPEEYIYNASIDESTNVYTLGAILFDCFFGNYTDVEVKLRYKMNMFMRCLFEQWELSKACYDIALKATLKERATRYATINEFFKAWCTALHTK